MVQLGMVLEQFPDEVIKYVASPLTGIQRRSQWPPSIADVVDACQERNELIIGLAKPSNPPRPAKPFVYQPPDEELTGPRMFVPWDHPKYERLVEWSKSAPHRKFMFGQSSDGRSGLWIAWDIWDGPNQLGNALRDQAPQA